MSIQTIAYSLKDIVNSDAFKKDLHDIAKYASHMKQEQQITNLLTKFYTTDTYVPIVECKVGGSDNRNKTMKHDIAFYDRMSSNIVKFEAKYHYDRDANKNHFEGPSGEIKRDFDYKSTDIFLWTICCRKIDASLDRGIINTKINYGIEYHIPSDPDNPWFRSRAFHKEIYEEHLNDIKSKGTSLMKEITNKYFFSLLDDESITVPIIIDAVTTNYIFYICYKNPAHE